MYVAAPEPSSESSSLAPPRSARADVEVPAAASSFAVCSTYASKAVSRNASMGASRSHARRKSMDVVELSLPSSLSSWPSSLGAHHLQVAGRARYRHPHVIGHGGHDVVLPEERRRRPEGLVPAVPARALLGGAARQQPELRVVGAVERAAPD